MSKGTLTYFNGRGLAEIPRLILAEAGVEYTDKRLEDIAALKPTLPFGQVPLWEEANGFRLVQSGTIARYLARTHGLYGKTVQESALIDQWIDGLNDLRAVVNAAKGDEVKTAALPKEVIPKWFTAFEALAKPNFTKHGVLVGDSVSWADIALFNLLDNYAVTYPGSVSAFPTLQAVHKKVAERPRIAAWLKSRPVSQW